MVALACFSLWGHVIDFARGAPEWTEELLRRVGKSPIDLYLQSNPLKIETFARELQHFGQLCEFFYLMQWSSSSDGDYLDCLPHSASATSRTIHPSVYGTPFLLPSNFGEYSPLLRQLAATANGATSTSVFPCSSDWKPFPLTISTFSGRHRLLNG